MKSAKRISILLFAFVVVLAICVLTLAACGSSGDSGAAPDIKPPHEHSYGAWEVVTEPTCTKRGLRRATCSLCGDVKEEILNTVAHTPEVRIGQKPTCTENGYTDETYCSLCGEILHTAEILFAVGHSFENWQTIAEPTCAENGVRRGTCSVCGQTVEENIDALGHDLIHHDGKEATCNENGWYEYDTCSRCDYTTFREIKPLRHEEVVDASIAPLCDDYGWTEGSHCARCGKTLVVAERIEPLGHSYDIVVDAGVEPSCETNGSTPMLQCSRCYKVQDSETIPALGHNYGEDDKCTRCGEWNEHDGFEFELNGEEYTLTGYHGGSAEVVIPANHHGLPVTEIGFEAFCQKDITSVTIPNSIKTIGQLSFESCRNLVSINIPNSVTTIGTYVFRNCENLQSVTIGSGVTSIDYETFTNCPAISEIYYAGDIEGWCKIEGRGVSELMLASSNKKFFVNGEELTGTLVIPSSVTAINGGAFAGCRGLTDVSIPSSVTSIGASAFSNCTGLTSIAIPNSVTSIEMYAFSGCTSLAHASLPSGLTSLYGTFDNCTSLTTITLPESLEDIGAYAFYGCTGLTSIVIPDGTKMSGQGSAFGGCTGLRSITSNADGAYKIAMFCGAPEFSVTITSGTFALDREIKNCAALTTLTFGDAVTSVGGFDGCTNLTSITFGSNVDEIYYAFNGCTGLTNVSFPDSLTSIGSAFKNCPGITSVVVPDSVENAYGAFEGCINLESIVANTIAASQIAQRCGSSKYDVTITTGSRINSFKGCTGLNSITIPDNVTEIHSDAFAGCTGLREIIGNATNAAIVAKGCGSPAFSVTVTSGDLADDAFENCAGLTFVTIGDGVSAIGLNAFGGCTNLLSVTLGQNVSTIGDNAFFGCYKLVEVCNLSLLEPVAGNDANGYVGYYAKQIINDQNASKLLVDEEDFIVYKDDAEDIFVGYFGRETDLVVPTSVRKIYTYAFSNKNLITSVELPSGVDSIGEYAFNECSALKSIDIPSGVTVVEKGTFYNCYNLRGVTIPNTVTSIGVEAFKYCYNLFAITIPESMESIGSGAFYECSELKSIEIPTGVTTIERETFYNCYNLRNVTIPNTVTSIGVEAFKYCYNLVTITIPESMESIGSGAFFDCKLIEVYTKSDKINRQHYLNMYVAFYGLNVYTEEGGSKLSTDENGFVVYTDGDDKILVDYIGDQTQITLPEGITEIYRSAFYKHNISSVILPNTVTEMGQYAFFGCSNLTEVTLSESLTSVFLNAFEDCDLSAIVIPNSVTDIYGGAFKNNYRLETVTLGSGLRSNSIEINAFENCNSVSIINYMGDIAGWCSIGNGYGKLPLSQAQLYIGGEKISEELIISDSVTRIGNGAFAGCNDLTAIYYTGDIASWCEIFGLYGLMSYGAPNKKLYINGEEITGSLIIPNGVTTIQYSAFRGCTGLTTVTIPNSVTTINSSAFRDCNDLTTIYYEGNKEQWSTISISASNDPILSATKYFYSEEEPTEEGDFWHYVDGVATVWE